MDDIAAGAGVSKPILYAYFGSKEGLYLAYIDRSGRELVDRLVNAQPWDERPGSRLRARVTEFMSFVEERADGWRVLFREAASSLPLAEEVATLRGRVAEAVRQMIEDAHPDVAPPAADAIAHALVGAGESLANWWLDHPTVARDQVAEWYLGIVQAVLADSSRSPYPA